MKQILKKPVITEKSMREAAKGKFTFEVEVLANKAEIAQAVKELYKVTPIGVQTITVPGTVKRARRSRHTIETSRTKKAIVTVKKGQTIDLFDITEEPKAPVSEVEKK